VDLILDMQSRMRHTGRVLPARGGVAALGMRGGEPMTDETPKRREFTRRRRANAEGGRQHFHKVGVTPEEEGMLARIAAAQHVTVPRLMVEAALSVERSETPTERKQAMAEMFAVHRLLAAISNNVNQMAKATNATGELQAEMTATLDAVRRVAARLDDAIDGLSAS